MGKYYRIILAIVLPVFLAIIFYMCGGGGTNLPDPDQPDVPGVTIIESGGFSNVTEDGATDDYSVVLDTQPSDTVTIEVTPDDQSDLGSGAGVATLLTFTTVNWDTPQTVSVSAVDEALAEGPHSSTISHSASSPTDPDYGPALIISDVIVNIADDTINCLGTSEDSTISGTVVTLIRSHQNGSPTYGFINPVRSKEDGTSISIDYMVHEPSATPKALVLLIAGGQLNANIQGSGSVVTFSGGNFLVRSAHLFAAQGFRVVTIDRPSDFLDDIGGSTSGTAYDPYRISVRHSVDLSTVINMANGIDNLPVFIVGTSRGAISAVAQNMLGEAIALSSPVTAGNGTPVGHPGSPPNVQPDFVQVPAHVMWHIQDACSTTQPVDSKNLVSALLSAGVDSASDAVSGGFEDPSQPNKCQANTFHGFLGIESCAVGTTTSWMDNVLFTLPTTRPQANAVSASTIINTQTMIDLSSFVTGINPLTFSLPYSDSSLGGTVSLSGTLVTYTPPSGVVNTTDTFVFVVTDGNGGTSHNVVSVAITF